MKIEESTVHLNATHAASRTQTLEMTTTREFRGLFASLAATPDDKAQERQRVQKLLQSLVEAIMAAMDGKKCEARLAADPLPEEGPPPASNRREMSWQRTTTQCVSESEQTTVCGSGQVRTADGRRIDFTFGLDLARSYTQTTTRSEAGSVELRDPLVISFAGKSCELTEERLCFDLDADGKAEQIPGLGAASGYLVFDRNGNGRADDGRELFGVASGDGFADLAQLDADHNGWIDEADPAYRQLSVWSGGALSTLAERGVGALYTAAVDAPFSLKTANNELLGQIRAAGLYLSESGEAGALQQVDLAVRADGDGQPEHGQRLDA